jgi:hypothetical protein
MPNIALPGRLTWNPRGTKLCTASSARLLRGKDTQRSAKPICRMTSNLDTKNKHLPVTKV